MNDAMRQWPLVNDPDMALGSLEALNRLRFVTTEPLITLHKNSTAPPLILYFDVYIRQQVGSSVLWHAIVESAAGGGDAAPTWLSITTSSGISLANPEDGHKGNFSMDVKSSIVLTASARGLSERSTNYRARLAVHIGAATETAPISPPVSIMIDARIIALPVASRCTLVAPGTVYAHVDHPKGFEFQARDYEGLPLARGGDIFEATLYACSNSSGSSSNSDGCNTALGTWPIGYVGGGRYSVQVILGRLGTYSVTVAFGGDPLPFRQTVIGICASGMYDDSRGKCVHCPSTVVCNGRSTPSLNASSRPGATLGTLALKRNHWRLSPFTSQIHTCVHVPDETIGAASRLIPTPCIGGLGTMSPDSASSWSTGSYCMPGTAGPLCRVCIVPGSFFNGSSCAPCAAEGAGVLALPFLCVLLASAALFGVTLTLRTQRNLRRSAGQLAARLGVLPKLKLAIAYFQVVLSMPEVFQVRLPPQYDALMAPLNFLSLDWLALAAPPECVGTLGTRLALQALLPLGALALVVAVSTVVTIVFNRRASGIGDGSSKGDGGACTHTLHVACDALRRGWLRVLPFVLAALFALVPSTSARIFAPFACDGFVERDPSASHPDGITRYYVHTDLSVACDAGPDYQSLRLLALTQIVLWPLGVPALFALLLYACHGAIVHRRPTALSRATTFLHGEYRPGLFPWELLELTRKLCLTSFILLVPQRYGLFRLVGALVLSIGYLVLMLAARPYRQPSNTYVATATNLTLCSTLLAALLVKVHAAMGVTEADRLFGVRDAAMLTSLIVGANLGVLLAAGLLLALALRAEAARPRLRLRSTGLAPELTLAPNREWHLFLSHHWDHQDIVAAVKRLLLLLLPGVAVFLDVDDLQSIDELEAQVGASAAVLVLLASPNYFSSANCLRELAAARAAESPLVLLHEGDSRKGGAALEALQIACPPELRGYVYGTPDRDDAGQSGVAVALNASGRKDGVTGRQVIQWHRLQDLQIVTMRKIAQAVVAASPLYARRAMRAPDSATSALALYLPGELSRRVPRFHQPVELWVSDANDGAHALASELIASCDTPMLVHAETPPYQLRRAANPPASLKRRLLDVMGARSTKQPTGGSGGGGSSAGSNAGASRCVMLLYLDKATWRDPRLAEEVRLVRSRGGAIVLAHETDSQRGGCDFATFFSTTPPDLIDGPHGKLYATLAVAVQQDADYRVVSLRLLARALGAQLVDERNSGCCVRRSTRPGVGVRRGGELPSTELLPSAGRRGGGAGATGPTSRGEDEVL